MTSLESQDQGKVLSELSTVVKNEGSEVAGLFLGLAWSRHKHRYLE